MVTWRTCIGNRIAEEVSIVSFGGTIQSSQKKIKNPVIYLVYKLFTNVVSLQ